MTIRKILRNNIIKSLYVMAVGVLLFIGGAITEMYLDQKGMPIVSLLGVAVIFVGQLYIYLYIKCPKCNDRIGHILLSTCNSIKMTTKTNYCPYCGISLESEVNIPV